ncbi:MAG: LysR family transcriptional regulator [Gammaproteobacteria bacterium]|jgi:DNA-binding transcriptional LysR family regulator|nr:LysR family transcriptional regulator [Gammaproteobacteria bacterium]MBT3489090.1 LysR family transcriptional regulator [Gammaproteobacteria bacterium]MBT3719113.1 LysR family transcriptional regulator [Gammaproteobacteria bacterium]MBT3843553.1 LysR family transcriptional regulator [Gammaproteobacteria bacterium]MBT3892747.1 LysR family transcriptional regulator [Gammaproteobacteria bacterium]
MPLNITFRQLRVFEAVARHSSFTRAAEELHLTQPAVSMQIKQLEENLGIALFEHLGKKIFLTDAGNEFYHTSRIIGRQLSDSEEYIENLKGMRQGHLNILVASTANYFATNLLATFIERHPEITFSLDVTNRQHLLQSLSSNEPDLVIMGQPPEKLDVVAEAFMENPLVVVVGNHHHLFLNHKPLTPEQIQHERFVVREQGSGTRTAMERFFEERNLHLETPMEFGSNETIKQAVQAGLGLALVSIHTIQLELKAGVLRVLEVDDLPIRRQWHLVYRKGKRLSPVADSFRQFVLDEGSLLVPKMG